MSGWTLPQWGGKLNGIGGGILSSCTLAGIIVTLGVDGSISS